MPDPGGFKSARHFAAWLGLTPRSHSSGGEERLGRISKMGKSGAPLSPRCRGNGRLAGAEAFDARDRSHSSGTLRAPADL
ncbi:transposase [Bradyrhizobium sp. CCGUVB1N3]|uniref:transposase n=1 Tax=unclassified Bradyrhizobium TaxID=2631580 RepID=UPI0020B2C859|nr:transposase [Bradyrhizobium sp. CCGUVB1N3]MCP3477672.1 transposase [Bradyrhizobium sp. CCGUVB1N3]